MYSTVGELVGERGTEALGVDVIDGTAVDTIADSEGVTKAVGLSVGLIAQDDIKRHTTSPMLIEVNLAETESGELI